MKTIELSTNLIGVDGFFCTYHGYGNSEYTLNEDMIKEDFETNETDIHPDYYWSYFDNNKYMLDWNSRVQDFIEENIIDIFKDVLGMNITYVSVGYHSPKYYNFSHDVNNFNLEADNFKPLIKYCLENKEKFSEFLKEHYTSYDGFMSNTSNNINDWKEDIKNDDETAWGATVRFLLENEDSILSYDNLREGYVEVFTDMFYTEYVDYSRLEEFMDDLKNGTLDIEFMSEEWEKAIFERNIVNSDTIINQIHEMYSQGSSVESINKILQDNFGEYNFESAIKEIFVRINNQSLKLF